MKPAAAWRVEHLGFLRWRALLLLPPDGPWFVIDSMWGGYEFFTRWGANRAARHVLRLIEETEA